MEKETDVFKSLDNKIRILKDKSEVLHELNNYKAEMERFIMNHFPSSPERTLVLVKLDEFLSQAKSCIVKNKD